MDKKSDQTFTNKIEAILFYEARPVRFTELEKILDATEGQVLKGLHSLRDALSERGITLVMNESSAELVTSRETSDLIESLRKQNLTGELGKASLECLTIVLYQSPVSRPDIDYIRGVNSQYSIRQLLIRGLIEKREETEKRNRVLYQPTTRLLSHLGISNLKDLPEYERVRSELETAYEEGV